MQDAAKDKRSDSRAAGHWSEAGCVLCGCHEASSELDKATSIGGLSRIRLLRCNACGHRYLADWPRTLALPLYDYYADRHEWPRSRVYGDLTSARYDELLAVIEAKVTGRRLLDVGCGAGHLVSVAANRGWHARGIDTSRAAVTLARRLGTNVEEQDFFSSELEDGSMDVVVMTEVIEHVPRPSEFLHRAFRLLVPGGLLYVTTPNFDSLTRRLVGPSWPPIHPEHISYFVTATLVRAARDVGFAIERIESRNTSPGLILNELRPPSRSVEATPKPNGDPTNTSVEAPDPTQILRRRIRESKALTALLNLVNVTLRVTHTGDTLVLWATRRG